MEVKAFVELLEQNGASSELIYVCKKKRKNFSNKGLL